MDEENLFIWERADWPAFRWSNQGLLQPLAAARLAQGRLLGGMERIGFELRREAGLEAITEDVVKSSEIEGEVFDRASVRSSLAKRLGVPRAGIAATDRRTEGVVEMALDATRNYEAPLTAERLFGWQAALFPTGFSGLQRVRTGGWRDGPIEVVSGPIGKYRVHFEGPPAARVEREMGAFFAWFNGHARNDQDGLLRAAIAHLWFITIHPFEDGNGRIARAIADQALAQAEGTPDRFYSMSSRIRVERDDYYQVLERTQRADLDVTEWLLWFVGCFSRALSGSEALLGNVLEKARFWDRHAGEPLSSRQRTMLSRLLDGIVGTLTAKKWSKLAKCSVPTAQRDINDLVARGVLAKNPGGSKNTSYRLA